ncbi:hypothetical protein CNMCM5878_006702 [Aspergillus fumigatiaffinis]|nr:hypothetical protein CNMCM6457_003699 [Aspergillus fumigatiaffinis]KAF4222107.1 hypothetical protein CNMCM5878_006702 [Aspergillus fumigatiaffinis]
MTANKPKNRIYRFYNVTGGNLVNSNKYEIYYHPKDEALYKIVDTHLLGYEWVQKDYLDNSTRNKPQLELETSIGYAVTTGEEWAQSLNIKTEFSGVNFSAGVEVGFQHKSFSEEEKSAITKRKVSCPVAANTKVILYTKVYHFKVHVWFQLDAWNEMWTVGKPGKDEVLEALSTFDIDAKEDLLEDEELRGRKAIAVKGTKSKGERKNIKRLEDCTRECQNYLRNNGFVGSWAPLHPRDDNPLADLWV